MNPPILPTNPIPNQCGNTNLSRCDQMVVPETPPRRCPRYAECLAKDMFCNEGNPHDGALGRAPQCDCG